MSTEETQVKRQSYPVYLLVVDDTPEFEVALAYTARLAKKNCARVALLYVMAQEDFQHWGSIEQTMRTEYRKEATSLLYKAADVVKSESGMLPAFYLQEGGSIDTITETIQNDYVITRFVLGANTGSSSPGPLVSYFTGKGLNSLRVPLTIVPDTVDLETLD